MLLINTLEHLPNNTNYYLCIQIPSPLVEQDSDAYNAGLATGALSHSEGSL